MRKFIKSIIYGVFYVLVLPLGLSSKIGYKLFSSQFLFSHFAEFLSLLPAHLGVVVRGCFYRQTLKSTVDYPVVLFGSHLTKIDSTLGRGVVVGGHTSLGTVDIEDDAAVGNHVSVLSGRYHHNFQDAEARVMDGSGASVRILIGKNSFIGDHSTVMANVGRYAIVGAGSVVVKDIPEYVVAVGNPAKVIKERPRPSAS